MLHLIGYPKEFAKIEPILVKASHSSVVVGGTINHSPHPCRSLDGTLDLLFFDDLLKAFRVVILEMGQISLDHDVRTSTS